MGKYDSDIHQQFGHWRKTYFSDSYNRQCYVQNTLQQISVNRKLNINDFTAILRSHRVRYHKEEQDDDYSSNGIDKGILGMDICAHASYGPVRCVNTTGSLIC